MAALELELDTELLETVEEDEEALDSEEVIALELDFAVEDEELLELTDDALERDLDDDCFFCLAVNQDR